MRTNFILSLTVGLMASLSALNAADVRSGLVAYWPLNTADFSGVPFTSDVVASNDFQLNSIPDLSSFTAGKYGQALRFDPTLIQYAFNIAPAGVDTGLPVSKNAAWSVLLWVKGTNIDSITSITNNDRRPYCESSSLIANPLMAIGTQINGTNGSIRTYIRNAGATTIDQQNSTNAAATTFNGDWHHIALVGQPGLVTLYVDGKLDMTNAYTKGTEAFDTTSIGAIYRVSSSPQAASLFNGSVDDVAVWSRALSLTEIQNVMSNSIATPVPQFAPVINVDPVGDTNLLIGYSWNFIGGVSGSRPMSFQWYKGVTPVQDATNLTLVMTNLAVSDSGAYKVVASNSLGSATSQVAQLTVSLDAAPNLTNRLISYWPLDTVIGTKTPDLVSGYDMTLQSMTAANVTPGKWGSAFSFTNTAGTMLHRLDNPGEDLPIYNKPEFTVSLWVNGFGTSPNQDKRVFSEGSTANNNPLFNIGTHNGGTDGSVDSFIRNDTGGTVGDHRHSIGIAYDGAWRHIAYVQRFIGGVRSAKLYVDGVEDSVVLGPTTPLTLNTTTIGGIRRSSFSAQFTGLIDEVAVWDRPLSQAEVTLLQTSYITNPPSRLQPLAANSFKADLPAIVKGGSTVLRWDVSKDANQVTINQGIGDVTAATLVGVGTNVITINSNITYILTVKRGAETISATTSVAVVEGVAPGWALLDNFETYGAGPLAGTGWWQDLRGTSMQVVNVGGNQMLGTITANSAATLPLNTLTVKEGQARTLFFKMMVRSDPAAAVRNVLGLTDKSLRDYPDSSGNVGSMFYSTFDNTIPGWFPTVRNGIGGIFEYDTFDSFESNVVYAVWLNITNISMTDPTAPWDLYSVFIQRAGFPQETRWTDYKSDRDPASVDVILGPMLPNLDKLVVGGNDATAGVVFDDIYLSTGGYNLTLPVPFASSQPVVLQIGRVGNQMLIQWPKGTLLSAPSPTGPWTNVTGATAPSYQFTPGPAVEYFRASN